MESKHTGRLPATQHELPWMVRGIGGAADIASVGDTHGNGSFLKVLNDGRGETAEYIVLACNAYHDLLAALSAMISEVEFLIDDGDLPPAAADHPSMRAARSAMAKARGE